MFKNPFQVAITFAIVALVLKLLFFSLEIQHGEMEKYVIYIYLLLVLVAVFFGIRSDKITQSSSSFGKDFKAGARTASFFAILIAVITYVYYAKIDSQFFEIKKMEIIDQYKTDIPSLIETKGKQETKKIVKGAIMKMSVIYSPYSQATYTLFALVIMGIFYSAVFALLMKKFPGFRQ